MAIITRYKFLGFSEVQIDQPAGLVSDGNFSTYTLDEPTLVPDGTGDFLGVIKSSVLLGDLQKETVDTKRYTIRQLNNFSYQQYLDEIEKGNILQRLERVGWVEVARSRASFYYKDCVTQTGTPGRQPTAEFFYQFDNFNFDGKVLQGTTDQNGRRLFGQQALVQVGTFDFNQIGQNLGIIGPNFFPLDLNTYMNTVFLGRNNPRIENTVGESEGITPYSGQALRFYDLLLATKGEHFNNQFGSPITSGVWGRSRDRIQGIRVDDNRDFQLVNTNTGPCIELPGFTVTPPPSGGDGQTTEDGDVYPEWDISTSGGGPNESGEYDYDTDDDTFVDLTSDLPPLESGCDDLFGLPVRYPQTDLTESSSFLLSVIKSGNEQNYNEAPGSSGNEDQFAFYTKKQEELEISGIVDPRETLRGTGGLQRGVLKLIRNSNECTLDVYPNFRDKDGDVPEIVGTELSSYTEKIRSGMMNRFFVNSPLKFIGNGSDGLEYYSDGNSYLELLGESLFGCGKPFAFSDIPEIFVEMYPIKPNDRNSLEQRNAEHYRFIIEKSLTYTSFILGLINAIGTNATRDIIESKKILLINDVLDDIVFGIPDMDFAQIGSIPSLTEDLSSIGGGVLTGLLSYYFSPETNETRKIFEAIRAAFVGYVGARSIFELQKTEEDLYNKSGNLLQVDILNGRTPIDIFTNGISVGTLGKTVKEKPITVFNYKNFDSFWSRPILSSVYTPNNGVSVTETIDSNASIIRTQTELLVKDFIPSSISDSVWIDSDRTVKDLKQLQFALSLPSRWKSMMRPIYQDLWYDQDAIKPENVSTTPYLGQPITSLELGDYETHRRLFGMRKNLYDEIDDAISTKIHTDTLSDPEITQTESGFFKALIDDSRRVFDEFQNRFSEFPSVQFMSRFEQFGMRLNNIKTIIESLNEADIKSYINLASESVNLYGLSRDTISSGAGTFFDFIKFFESVVGLFRPNSPEFEKANEYFKNEAVSLGKRVVQSIFREITTYIIVSGLDYLEAALEVRDTRKTSLSPRRIMKPGSVLLQSRSERYITNKQPCPIIFLGFNDDAIMSGFSDLVPGGLECLSTLTKNDRISTIKCSNIYSIQKGKQVPLFADVLQTNLGNVAVQLDLTSEPNIGLGRSIGEQTGSTTTPPYEYTRYSKVDTIPTINKRIKQYGRNPFLDIFYLNLIPDSYYADGATQAQRDTKMHLTATPSPFRYPTINNIRFSKVMNSHIPSIFPPWWNEPMGVEQNPNASVHYLPSVFKDSKYDTNVLGEGDSTATFWRELQNWNIGDLHFKDRRPNNILKAKDRWSMRIESFSANRGDSVVVLKDKTPILDIYFGLLNLHTFGIGWDVIVPLIRETKNALQIATYFREGRLVPDEEKSRINLESLETINSKIQSLLKSRTPIVATGNTTWKSIPISLDAPRKETKTVTIYNNIRDSNVSVEILRDQIRVVPISGPDRFGQTAENVFYFGDISITSSEAKITPSVSPEFIVKTWFIQNGKLTVPKIFSKVELPVHFIPFRVEEGFEYKATLEIPVLIDGELLIVTRPLSAKCLDSVRNLAQTDEFVNTLKVPYSVHFGAVSDITTYTEPVSQTIVNDGYNIPIGLNIKEDVLITSFRIENQRIRDKNRRDLTTEFFGENPAEIFRFSKSDLSYNLSPIHMFNKVLVEEFYEPLRYKTELAANRFGTYTVPAFTPVVQIDKDAIMTTNPAWGGNLRKSSYYTAKVIIDYVLSPRLNSNEFIEREDFFNLEFITP